MSSCLPPGDPEVVEYARQFNSIMAWSLLPQFAYVGLTSWCAHTVASAPARRSPCVFCALGGSRPSASCCRRRLPRASLWLRMQPSTTSSSMATARLRASGLSALAPFCAWLSRRLPLSHLVHILLACRLAARHGLVLLRPADRLHAVCCCHKRFAAGLPCWVEVLPHYRLSRRLPQGLLVWLVDAVN